MLILCKDNSGHETRLTNQKIYIGKQLTVGMFAGWWEVEQCDDGQTGSFMAERFEEVVIGDVGAKNIYSE
jgi:hypothetical protein